MLIPVHVPAAAAANAVASVSRQPISAAAAVFNIWP